MNEDTTNHKAASIDTPDIGNVKVVWYESFDAYIQATEPDYKNETENERFWELTSQAPVTGVSYRQTMEIHMMAIPEADPQEVAHVLGHEFGHLTGIPAEDDLAEETRADLYGEVAALVFRIMTERKAC